MTEEQALLVVIEQFERSHLDYVLVGGLAFNLYGIPRFTADAEPRMDAEETRIQRMRRFSHPRKSASIRG